MAERAGIDVLPLTGNEDLRLRLRQAAVRGSLPQSLLFHGPVGVGKQRLGLWLAAMLLCEADAEARPCGECRSCRLADSLQHPDIHWFFPLERPKGPSDKLKQKLEEARLEKLDERRNDPLRGGEPNPAASIYLAAVEQLRAMAAKRPAMGRHMVFVVGEADRMVPQAANPEAANAFLKLLEEPPSDAFIVLTSSRPGTLLPTVRSRVLAVRVLPVREEQVREHLVAHGAADDQLAARLARQAGGSIGAALSILAGRDSDQSPVPQQAAELLHVCLHGTRTDRYRAAMGFGARGARQVLIPLLEEMESLLRDCLAVVSDEPGAATRPDVVARLLAKGRPSSLALLEAHRHLDVALESAAANAAPSGVVAVLLDEIATAFATSEHLVLSGWNRR